MWNKVKLVKKQNRMCKHQLSREILGSFGMTALCSFFSFWILNEIANRIVLNYAESEVLLISEDQLIDIQYGILGISMVSGVILFVMLFLFLVGERLSYITEIVNGIDALGRREWGYQIPVQGENELTELAKRVNELSKEEQAFQKKEKQMQEEKIAFIRSLSHDIRTPLTSMMSYSEFMKQKADLTQEEVKNYMALVEQKSQQIKLLTDRLLNGGNRQLEFIGHGRFLMEQLVDEWESELEEEFNCQVDLESCPEFKGEFDIEELRRIFDNLVSNIRKYADETEPVLLDVKEQNGRVCICQSNVCRILNAPVESTKIGIGSIRTIAAHYGGDVQVLQEDGKFSILIKLGKVS